MVKFSLHRDDRLMSFPVDLTLHSMAQSLGVDQDGKVQDALDKLAGMEKQTRNVSNDLYRVSSRSTRLYS